MNSGNMAKVACIKHFNSSNSMKSQQQQQLIMSPNQAAAMISLNYAPPLATQSSLSSLAAQNNNGKQIITYYSLSSLNQQQQQHHPHFENQRDHPVLKTTTTTSATITNSLSFKQLNVNDLYAILKPVIKPHIHNPILESYVDSSRASSNNKHALLAADVIYLGSIYVPYDTLSNASKLNSIRSSIEYFTGKSSASFSHFEPPAVPSSTGSWVNLKIFSDRIKLSNRVS
jgi:hypothetical protein